MDLRLSRVLVMLAAAACTRQTVDLMDRACSVTSSDDCTDGFVCNPMTSACTTPVRTGCSDEGAVCPSTTQDGDACTDVGTFLPCADGTAGCAQGCRLCEADHTWGMCSGCLISNGGVEVCDGFDNDCNGLIDDGNPIQGCIDSYVDADHDGFGTGDPICSCGVPYGRSRIPGDPDDTNPNISPDTGELCDGIDNNHDGSSLARETDDDGDGYVECSNWVGNVAGVVGGGDCDDTDDQTHPNAPAELCDGIPNTCTASIPANELDADGDGYVACAPWVDRHLIYPLVFGGGDCAPNDPTIHPKAAEIYDTKDNNCNGKKDECLADCDCGSRLVSCYPMESDASDLGPAGVDCSLVSGNNPSLTTGIIGNAYSIPSIDPLQGPTSSAPDVARFTLSLFIRPTSFPGTGNTWREIIDVQSEYGMELAKGGVLDCFYADSSGYVTLQANVLTTNTWQHVGCTYDGATLTLYANGNVATSTPTSTAVRANKMGVLRIGSNSPESGDTSMEAFAGAIDQVKIFKEALSDKEMCGESLRTDCP